MPWKIEIIQPETEPVLHENVILKMGHYSVNVLARPSAHLVALERDGTTVIRALGFGVAGFIPDFNETGFSAIGAGAILRDSIANFSSGPREVTLAVERVHDEEWRVSVDTATSEQR